MKNQISNDNYDSYAEFKENVKKAVIQSQIVKTKKLCEIEKYLNNNPKQVNRIIANLTLMSMGELNKDDFIDK
jgi:hypothetical protein